MLRGQTTQTKSIDWSGGEKVNKSVNCSPSSVSGFVLKRDKGKQTRTDTLLWSMMKNRVYI